MNRISRSRLERMAQQQAIACEHYSRLAMQPLTSTNHVERVRLATYRQLARIYACEAFALSAQAARL
jgi:hypothetical protein